MIITGLDFNPFQDLLIHLCKTEIVITIKDIMDIRMEIIQPDICVTVGAEQ